MGRRSVRVALATRTLRYNARMPTDPNILILGGGAAGFLAAITCAETNPRARVTLFEKGRALLSKVRISGGGRCNVTHACFDPALLVQHYPRGRAALRGPFTRFQPRDTLTWFEQRGVSLKIENDGRVFPVTDRSETIVDCLLSAAHHAGVAIRTQAIITSIEPGARSGFVTQSRTGEKLNRRSDPAGNREQSAGLYVGGGPRPRDRAASSVTLHLHRRRSSSPRSGGRLCAERASRN